MRIVGVPKAVRRGPHIPIFPDLFFYLNKYIDDHAFDLN